MANVKLASEIFRACRLLAIPLFTCFSGTAAEIPAAAPMGAPTNAASFAPDKVPAGPPQISYVGGQLTIRALNATLTDVLAKVSALIGVAIDMPEGASSEVTPILLLGPGPAREVLASLLSGAHFDYMMQAAESDAEKLQSVLIMPRKKPGPENGGADTATVSARSPYARVAPPSADVDPAAEPPISAAAPSQNTAADASASNSQNLPTQPDQSAGAALMQRDLSNSPKPGQLTPPATLTPQSMNEQLQQMYQQRIQITQQQRAAAPATQP